MTDQGGRGEATDADAIAASLADPEAFVTVFERYFSMIHRFLRVRVGDADADDLAAQTFEVAFRRRGDYDQSRTDARPWLFGIAIRLANEHHRRQRRLLAALGRLLAREAQEGDAAADPPVEVDGAPELRAALAAVRAEDRDLLFLHACVELSYEECAAALGLPVGTVRSRLHRARVRLRRQLDNGVALELGAGR
jgi:RNA polymerase sigma factor (sigma-70 family)